jgi:hypothetical protein
MRPSRDEVRSKELAYGATNLLRQHVEIREISKKFGEGARFLTAEVGGTPHPTPAAGPVAIFNFRGKKGVQQTFSTANPILVQYLQERLKTDKEEIFDTNEDAVNAFLKDVSGGLTAKDFRTIRANEIAEKVVAANAGQSERKLRQLVGEAVASALQNTPAVALESYVDPEIFKVDQVDQVKVDQVKPTRSASKEKPAMLPGLGIVEGIVEGAVSSVRDSIGPTKCRENDDHLVKLGDAYSCCRKQLLSINQMTTRFVDFFQGLVDAKNQPFTWTEVMRKELLRLFDEFKVVDGGMRYAFAPGSVGVAGGVALSPLPVVPPMGLGGQNVVMVRGEEGSANLPVGAIIPWQLPGWEPDVETFPEDSANPDTPTVEAVVMQDQFWANPETMLQTATAVLHAIDRSVRRRVKAENCCACLRNKIMSHERKKAKTKGPIWSRKSGGGGGGTLDQVVDEVTDRILPR